MSDPTVVNSDLSLLAPKFRAAIEAAIETCKKTAFRGEMLDVRVFEGFRNGARQAWLYSQGRTRPGKIVTNAKTNLTSWHGYGLAVDVIHRTRYWEPYLKDEASNEAWFKAVSEVFKTHGCKWGGDFKKPDTPHMQWGKCPASPSQAVIDLVRSKGVNAVWDRLDASGRTVVLPAASASNVEELPTAGFRSLAGGFYSSTPFDIAKKRSIRTNNPGALNVSAWQRIFPGFAGETHPDRAGNVTTIYATPEHGCGAWFHLLSNRYGFGPNGRLTIKDLAMRYAGTKNPNTLSVQHYVNGWRKASGNALSEASVIELGVDASVLVLARAMFDHEAGEKSPLSDAQILFGMNGQKNGTLPRT